MGDTFHNPAGTAADNYSDKASGDADQDGFYQELAQDVDATCTDRHAQTDLTGTLCDADVHDIHDADAAYYERYAGNAGEQCGHQVGGRIEHAAQFLLAPDGEIIVIRLFQLVIAAEKFGNLFRSIVRHVFRKSRSVDTLQIGLCQQTLHHGGVGCQYDVVLVHTHRVVSLGFQYAYYTERYFAEPDNASYRIFSIGEKIVYNGFSYHAYLGARLDIGFAEHLSIVYRELSNFQILRSHAIHG